MAKKNLLKDVTSIRQKIMLPFMVMMGILAVSLIWISTHFLNGILVDQASNKATIFHEKFQSDFERVSNMYSQSLSQLSKTKLVDISGYVSALKKQQGYQVYWNSVDKTAFFGGAEDSLSADIAKGGFAYKMALEIQEARLASIHWVGAASVKGTRKKRHELFVSTQAASFPIQETEGQSWGVFYQPELLSDPTQTQPSVPIHLSTEFRDNSGLVSLVTGLLSYKPPREKGPIDQMIRYKTDSYRMIARVVADQPTVVTVVLVSMSDIYAQTLRLVGMGILFLVLIGGVIFFIYSVIIRKITTSLEILASVAKKVSSGDLDQHIYSSSKDEIGSLSKTFNLMISNLKSSSAKLLHEKKQSEAIMASIPEGILVTDLSHKVVVANGTAETFLGFSFDTAEGKDVEEVIDNPDLLSALTQKLKKKSGPKVQEVRIVDSKKHQIFELTSSPVMGERSKMLGQVTVIRDITHDKELEELRDSFLRTVSHELRTPLTSIIGFIDLVKGQEVSDDQKKYLQIAYDEAISLKELINNLLELSRIEAGDKDMALGTVKVASFVDQIATSLEPIAKGSGLDLVNHITNESLEISVDSLKLKGIFINLISNAIKFTDAGSVELFVVDKKDCLEFSVKDTGIGLNEEEKEIIFEKFRQVDYSATRQYEGIGLGLSLVKQLVGLHDGKLWVESEYGKGSTFYFTISKKLT